MHVEVPVVAARELTQGVRLRREAAGDPTVEMTAHSAMQSMPTRKIAADGEPESSASVRARVIAARRVQERRFASQKRRADDEGGGRASVAHDGGAIHCNAQMGIREIERHCRVDDTTRALLHKAMEMRSMSARAVHRVLRVARTIADLAGSEEIALEHVAEAAQYQSVITQAEA